MSNFVSPPAYPGVYPGLITLLFDPKDQNYPFKGKSLLGTEYKIKAK
jgi:hypothetical protein